MRYRTEKKQFLCPVLDRPVSMTLEYALSDGAAAHDKKLLSIADCSCGQYDECFHKDEHDRCVVVQKYC